jgi:hypothetical protein
MLDLFDLLLAVPFYSAFLHGRFHFWFWVFGSPFFHEYRWTTSGTPQNARNILNVIPPSELIRVGPPYDRCEGDDDSRDETAAFRFSHHNLLLLLLLSIVPAFAALITHHSPSRLYHHNHPNEVFTSH